MLDKELLLRVLKRSLTYGGDYAEIFVEHKRSVLIHLEDSHIEKVITGIDCGAGIRLICNGKSAYAFSNDLSETSLQSAAAEVSKAASGMATNTLIDLRTKSPSVSFSIKHLPDDVPIEKKIALIREADRVARGFDQRVRQASIIYNDSVQKVQIATSDGMIAEDDRVHTVIALQVIAMDNGIVQTGYEANGGLVGFELFDEIDMNTLSLKATKRAVMMLTARRAPGGRMPVVISSEAGGTMIHEAIGHGLEADLAQQGISVYSKKIGQQVASPLVTVVDDSTIHQKRGSFRFDDEGTPSQRSVLVEKGILKTYMYDKPTALKDGVASTGNGRRQSYRHRPMPRMTNTFIAPCETSPEEIIRSVEYGLFVKKMGGGQVNTITGDFVFGVLEGYLIRKGIIEEPVRGATLAGNGPEVLKSIDMIGSDLGFSIGTCGKDSQGVPVSDAIPTVRIPDMLVGGEL
ncbi:MAG: TldD/PmbA family protein [Nitrospira sp.]|nr:TldD/PmbA family protein [Nitrospira sp.]